MSQTAISKVISIMNKVYGEYHGTHWKPKPYADNKSRYLWTDAFGVINYLNLYCETKEQKFLDQAKLLVEDVHDTLGKNRNLTKRLGNATEENPCVSGLRIGKVDEDGDDCDGQYFHYLTKWMFALNRMSFVTNESKYNRWAVNMSKAIVPKFVSASNPARPRMFWKLSIDLSYPLVPSEGNLDPFDGLVTLRLLQRQLPKEEKDELNGEIALFEEMVQNKYERYFSNDPLDLGEALCLTSLAIDPKDSGWSHRIQTVSLMCLEKLWNHGYFNQPERYRLCFREMGTTIGVQLSNESKERWKERVDDLHRFWSERIFKRDSDITPVMFCASLFPGLWNSNHKI